MDAPPTFSGDVFAWLTNPVPLADEPAFRVDGLSATDGTMFPWNEVRFDIARDLDLLKKPLTCTGT